MEQVFHFMGSNKSSLKKNTYIMPKMLYMSDQIKDLGHIDPILIMRSAVNDNQLITTMAVN
jgi:hypothetical protein